MQLSFTGERYVPELRGQIYYEHFHRYSLALDLARGKDVLDISCGEGYGTAALALVARTVVGMDIDAPSVRHAAARYTAMNIDFRVGDCCDIPAGDATFDLIVSFETIEHLSGQERMLSEFKRILRPDGRLVISSPNKLVYSDARAYSNPFHVRELYFHEFRDMLRSFFPEVRIFGQRVFAASAVHPLRGAADETRWLGPSTVGEATIGALPDPEYFVAVCSRRYGDSLPDMSSVYVDPRDELLADITSGGTVGAADGPAALDVVPSIGMLSAGEQRSLPAPTAAVQPIAGGASLQEQIALLEQTNTALAQRNEALEKIAGTRDVSLDDLIAERDALARAADEARAAAAEALAGKREAEARANTLSLDLMQRAADHDEALATAARADEELRAEREARRNVDRTVAQLQLERQNYDDFMERATASEALLAEVLGSTSWRLTMPARKLMKRLRGK